MKYQINSGTKVIIKYGRLKDKTGIVINENPFSFQSPLNTEYVVLIDGGRYDNGTADIYDYSQLKIINGEI